MHDVNLLLKIYIKWLAHNFLHFFICLLGSFLLFPLYPFVDFENQLSKFQTCRAIDSKEFIFAWCAIAGIHARGTVRIAYCWKERNQIQTQAKKKAEKTSNVCHTMFLSSQHCRCKRLGQCIPHSHMGWCSWLVGKLWNDETTQKQGRHTIVANRSKPAANTRAIGISNTDSIVLTSIRTESYVK